MIYFCLQNTSVNMFVSVYEKLCYKCVHITRHLWPHAGRSLEKLKYKDKEGHIKDLGRLLGKR